MSIEKQNLNLRYIFTTRRQLLMTGAAGLAMVVLILMVVVPQIGQSLTLWKSWKREQVARDQLRKKVAQLQDVVSGASAEQAELVNSVLPSKKPLLELMSGLGLVAQNSQVVFTTVELTPGSIASGAGETPDVKAKAKPKKDAKAAPRTTQPYESLDVDLTVTGRLADINRFFLEVEKLAPATTISSISLNKAKGVKRPTGTASVSAAIDPEELYEAEITVETYYFTKSIAAALDAPLPQVSNEDLQLLTVLASYIKGGVVTQDRVEGGGLKDLFGQVDSQVFQFEPTTTVVTPAN